MVKRIELGCFAVDAGKLFRSFVSPFALLTFLLTLYTAPINSCETEHHRQVPYCSKECSEADWKFGGHKIFCGKRFTDLALPFPGSVTPSHSSPPSLSLLWQLHMNHRSSNDKTAGVEEGLYRIEIYEPSSHFPLHHSTLCFTPQTQPLQPLLKKAAETRTKEDIREFISMLASIVGTNPDLQMKDFVDQLAADWIEIEKREIEVWSKEGWRIAEEKLTSRTIELMYEMMAFNDEEDSLD